MPKISEYSNVSKLDGTEEIVVNQGGVTHAALISDIAPIGITAAETAATITPIYYQYNPWVYDVRRVGIVPNDTGARAANSAALPSPIIEAAFSVPPRRPFS